MRLEGELNIKNIKSLYLSLKDELAGNDQVILDMKDVVSIDASAAQVLLSATIKAKETGKNLRLVNVSAILNKILTLVGLGVEEVQGGDDE